MRKIGLAALGATAIAVVPALGTFSNVSVELVELEDCQRTYRIYAHFAEPTQLLGVSATPDIPIQFASNRPLVNDGGSLAETRFEDFAMFPLSNARDSWVTVGHEHASFNDTTYSTGFLGGDGSTSVVAGCEWFQFEDGGWLDNQPATAVVGTQLLLAQFTFQDTRTFAFFLSGNVAWRAAPGEETKHSFFVAQDAVSQGSCVADVDEDGIVNFQDLLLVLSSWGLCDGCCPADVDYDGVVSFQDLLLVLTGFNTHCP